MRPAVTYTPYVSSLKEQTGDVITFTQFEEGNILTETCNGAESCDKSNNEPIMMSEQDMENINYGDESDHDLISMDQAQKGFRGIFVGITEHQKGYLVYVFI